MLIGNNTVGNNFVVPYNKHLCKKYNCHINVEVFTSVKAVKYIFKYIYKGYDCIDLDVRGPSADNANLIYDEVKQHLNARYVSAPEAMWRLLENKMHDKSYAVMRLPVHLDQQQMVYFEGGEEQQAFDRATLQNTPLTAFFVLNQEDPEARELLYSDLPQHFVFDKKNKRWKRRESLQQSGPPLVHSEPQR